MAKKVEFLCVANSLKMGERCVAGITSKGKWVRLVSKRPNGALTTQECRLEDGTDPRHFDEISVEVEGARPERHQPENLLITGSPWKLKSRVASSNHKGLIENQLSTEGPLLGIVGKGVEFAALEKKPLEMSLGLYEPPSPKVFITIDPYRKKKIRARFAFRGLPYDLGITDLEVIQKAKNVPEGTYDLREFLGLSAKKRILLLISVTEPFDANGYQGPHCFKVVASILAI